MTEPLPDPALLVLVGPSGSGKSTWARSRYRDQEIVSSDQLRGIVGSGHERPRRFGRRVPPARPDRRGSRRRGLTTVVDTLGLDRDRRLAHLDVARRSGLPAVAVVFDTPERLCRARNAARDRPVPAPVLTEQLRRTAGVTLVEEGWDHVVRVGSADPPAPVTNKPPIGGGAVASGDLVLQVSRFPWGEDPVGWLRDIVSLAGRPHVSFGSCSYLGLELDPRMRDATIDAVTRYGTQFSSSRGLSADPQYLELEPLLDENVRRPRARHADDIARAPGHAAGDRLLARRGAARPPGARVSVQMAANQLRVMGTTVDLIRHNNMERLEAMIQRVASDHDRIWYMADGVCSMFADLAPFDELRALLDKHPQLHLYVDDSHGVGWAGKRGHGPALDALGGHPRVVASCSLNKSFAAAGEGRWSSRTAECGARSARRAAR